MPSSVRRQSGLIPSPVDGREAPVTGFPEEIAPGG